MKRNLCKRVARRIEGVKAPRTNISQKIRSRSDTWKDEKSKIKNADVRMDRKRGHEQKKKGFDHGAIRTPMLWWFCTENQRLNH